MSGIGILILITIAIIGIIILWKILKPYLIKYDTTLLLTGGLGSGKTLTAVKTSVILLRKQRLKTTIHNKIKKPFVNFIKKLWAKINKKYKPKLIEKKRKPQLYSNIPIHFNQSIWKPNREWAIKLNVNQLFLYEEIIEGSIVLIDELPQIVNQFNWNLKQVQDNVNEWITFFRHYIGGYLICTAQATDDVVAQIRRKLNQAVWCFDFNKFSIFGIPLFYTIRMCDVMLNDDMSTFTTSYIEDNTKRHFGLFPPRNTYDTRCYSERMKNVLIKAKKQERFNNIKTNEIIKIKYYDSPLDDYKELTEKQRLEKLNLQLNELKEKTKR